MPRRRTIAVGVDTSGHIRLCSIEIGNRRCVDPPIKHDRITAGPPDVARVAVAYRGGDAVAMVVGGGDPPGSSSFQERGCNNG